MYRMYLIPFGQLVGSLLNAIFGKCFRNVRAEPYYFGFNGININHHKKSDYVSFPSVNDGQNAPLIMDKVGMPTDGGNITSINYNNNNNNNIIPYQTFADTQPIINE